MRQKIQALIREKDGLRGAVPSRFYGNKDKVYGAYLESLKPRENKDLQVALATSGDTRYEEFLARISETRYKRISLQTIAKACGIDLKEFGDWWNRASTQRAIAVAQTSTVDIVRDLVEDARTVKTVCERCDGMTFVTAPAGLPKSTPGYKSMKNGDETVWIRTCPNCVDGKVSKPGDTHSRDKILEMSGLIRKGAAVNVNVNNFGGASHASAISKLDDAMAIDV